jgi:hypothetical protein
VRGVAEVTNARERLVEAGPWAWSGIEFSETFVNELVPSALAPLGQLQ